MIHRLLVPVPVALLSAISSAIPAVATTQDSFQSLTAHVWAWISSDDHSANGALFAGDNSALVVDPGLTPAHARSFLEAARRATTAPIRYVVTTHWHPDHALGISCLGDRPGIWVADSTVGTRPGELGSAILDNVAREAASPVATEMRDCPLSIPDSVITRTARFDLGNYVVEARPVGPAHTAGDVVVWNQTERVLVTGDLFLFNSSPSMSGGDPRVWVRALDEMVEMNPTFVVAGHFGPSRPADLVRFRNYLTTLVNEVTTAVERGITDDSLRTAVDLSDVSGFAPYPQYRATFEDNVLFVARFLRMLEHSEP